MATIGRRLRLGIRVGESLLLSAAAGLFVWLLGFTFRLPLVWAALLGFLAGGTATLRTLGVDIRDRRLRAVLALAAALTGYSVWQALDYATFVHYQRRAQRAADFEATPAVIDARIAADLRQMTGHAGPLGYALAALRARGPWRGALAAAELLLVLVVAVRWAAGPGS